MRRSIPGKKKDPIAEAEEKLMQKLKISETFFDKPLPTEPIKLGRTGLEKGASLKPERKPHVPGQMVHIAKEKIREERERKAAEKGMEFVADLDITAKQIINSNLKYRPLGNHNTKKTEEVVLEILNCLARGDSLSTICKRADMPSMSTVQTWIRTDPDFQRAYVQAQEFRMNVFADQILDIADNSVGDIRMAYDKFGNVIPEVSYENIKRSELRIKTRQYLMEKFYSKQYGRQKDEANDDDRKNPKHGNIIVQIALPDNGRAIESKTIEM